MIDPEQENIIGFAEASRRLPRASSGRPVQVQTVARWCLVGIHGVRLESVRVGGRRMTSAEACRRFIAAIADSYLAAAGMKAGPRRLTAEEARGELIRRGYLVAPQ
jgi:hypothetical protein